MKRFLYLVIFLLSLQCIQAQAITAPYKRFKTIPPAKLLSLDSTTTWLLKDKLEKKKAVLLVLFSPECDHCNHEAEELVKNSKDFKHIQIVMSSTKPLWQINEFVKKHGLQQFSNITVGKDIGYVLPPYFDIHSLPFHAFFNKKQELSAVFEGSMSAEKLKVFTAL